MNEIIGLWLLSYAVSKHYLNLTSSLTLVVLIADFSVVEQKIESRTYYLLEDFVTDVLEVFSNCRMYNNRLSPVFNSAIRVEMEFLSNFEKLKTEVFQL